MNDWIKMVAAVAVVLVILAETHARAREQVDAYVERTGASVEQCERDEALRLARTGEGDPGGCKHD